MSEGIQSKVEMLVLVSSTQSVGGGLRMPRLTEVSQIGIKAKLRRRDVTEQAPERLDGEGSEVNLRYKQFSTSPIYFSSDYYKSKMPMISVVFLTASVCQTVPKESSPEPKFQSTTSKNNVKKDAEVFPYKSRREGAALGWI